MEGMVFHTNIPAMKVYRRHTDDHTALFGHQLMEAEGEPFDNIVQQRPELVSRLGIMWITKKSIPFIQNIVHVSASTYSAHDKKCKYSTVRTIV